MPTGQVPPRGRLSARSQLVILGFISLWIWRTFRVLVPTLETTRDDDAPDPFLYGYLEQAAGDKLVTKPKWSNEHGVPHMRSVEMAKQYEPSPKARQLVQGNKQCLGKERLLDIILRTGSDVDSKLCAQLPTWQQVVDIYGEGPIVHGLDTCADYRQLLSPTANDGKAIAPMPRVAGNYHSGTNALTKTFELNFGELEYYSQFNPYEVAWGKHVPPAKYRWINTFPENNPDSKEHILPIVIIRDPFRWMRSMCKEPYDAKFFKVSYSRCPQMILAKPSGPKYLNQVEVKAHQTGKRFTDYYDTLADFWTEYHRQYLEADYPSIMIRFEDMLFYGEEVMAILSECTGIPLQGDFRYAAGDARGWRSDGTAARGLVDALIKHGGKDPYYEKTMAPRDKKYLLKALDPHILDLFHYNMYDLGAKVDEV